MPNWVYNHVHFRTNTKAQMDKFIATVGKPIPTVNIDERDENNKPNKVKMIEFQETQFSFWNIVAPPKSMWKDYFSVSDSNKPKNNWYNWNNANWGTKWDVNYRIEEFERESDTELYVHFDTAWSPPMGVMYALAQKFPKVSVSWGWEEEQGFGGEFEIEDGEVTETASWDIPSSHADFEERGHTCNCDWLEEDDWFDDCPRGIERLVKVLPDHIPDRTVRQDSESIQQEEKENA